jgi:hypothetical protein
MSAFPCPVYLFKSEGFAPSGETVVCVAPVDRVISVYGGGGPFDMDGLAAAFGDAVIFRNDETGQCFTGVWGRRCASRFRSQLRTTMQIVIRKEAPEARLTTRTTTAERPQKTIL